MLNTTKPIPVGISNRHFHISQADLEVLYGQGHRLTKAREISQIGQFAAQETLAVEGPRGRIDRIRIVGPVRPHTQLEISFSDAYRLGLSPPVRYSGDIRGSAGAVLIGPAGRLELREGVIIPVRHIHMSPADAKVFGVFDGARVMVAPLRLPAFSTTDEPRSMVFDNVVVRVHERFVLDFHLDLDEANASGLKNGDRVRLSGFSALNRQVPRVGLITENDVRQAILRKTLILVGPHTRLTPAARDLGKEHNVFMQAG